VRERSQSEKVDPRVLGTRRWWAQVSQRPAAGGIDFNRTSLCIVLGVSTFRRLLGFLRPYRRGLVLSLILAWFAMGMTVLIPLLVGAAVNAIEDGRRDDLLPIAGAILGAGILRLALTFSRRVYAGKVSLGVE
jgi:hypothetical protein